MANGLQRMAIISQGILLKYVADNYESGLVRL